MILCNIINSSYVTLREIKQVQTIDDKKCYIPNEALVNFIQNWLRLHRKKNELKEQGKDLTPEEAAELAGLRRMKPYVLDNVVFPAMANLTYFFEALAVSKKLSEAFDDDVLELLDPGRAADAAKSGGADWRMSYIQFRNNNLARLIISMLSIHTDNTNTEKPVMDFRIALMYQLLNIIGDLMDHLISTQYHYGNQIWKSAMADYARMKGWIGLLAGSTEDHREEHTRMIGFTPIWYSSKADLSSFNL